MRYFRPFYKAQWKTSQPSVKSMGDQKNPCNGSSQEVKNKKRDFFFFSFLKPLSNKREFALKILTNVHDPTVF